MRKWEDMSQETLAAILDRIEHVLQDLKRANEADLENSKSEYLTTLRQGSLMAYRVVLDALLSYKA